jgi:DnaJ-class molecular chaperone
MNIVKYNVIIIERLANAFLVKCGYCDSGGSVRGDPCEVCDGKGYVGLKIPASWDCDVGILKCAYCDGGGSVRGDPCEVCHGCGSIWVGKLRAY